MQIKRFHALQAEEVATLIKRTLLEINSQYYSPEYIASIMRHLSAANLIELAKTEHIFVAIEEEEIVGTGNYPILGVATIPAIMAQQYL